MALKSNLKETLWLANLMFIAHYHASSSESYGTLLGRLNCPFVRDFEVTEKISLISIQMTFTIFEFEFCRKLEFIAKGNIFTEYNCTKKVMNNKISI